MLVDAPLGAQRVFTLLLHNHIITSLPPVTTGTIHAVLLFAPNCNPTIPVLQQKSRQKVNYVNYNRSFMFLS